MFTQTKVEESSEGFRVASELYLSKPNVDFVIGVERDKRHYGEWIIFDGGSYQLVVLALFVLKLSYDY
ncbi:MAG: hypothetical protein HYT61_01655 [Candidatus Yanofskybacteria bacterium]|nr:hypothetical protein [Candidatus Yanofskybacteria bacterium]